MTPPITLPQWIWGVFGTVAAGVILALVVNLPSSFAQPAVDQHDRDPVAHAQQFNDLKAAINANGNKLGTLEVEVRALKENQHSIVEGQKETQKLLRELIKKTP